MAHFAQLDANNTVVQVIVIAEDMAPTEEAGVEFCKRLFGADTVWLQTSYNTQGNVHLLGGTPFRKNYAGVGYLYNPSLDAFISPQPVQDGKTFNLDKQTGTWIDVTPSTFTGVTRL
jgi:hypothetical protein